MKNQNALNRLAVLEKLNAPFQCLPTEQQRQLEFTKNRLETIQQELSDLTLVLSSQSDLSCYAAEYLSELQDNLKVGARHQLPEDIMLGLFAALNNASAMAERIRSEIVDIEQQLPDFRSQRMTASEVEAQEGAE